MVDRDVELATLVTIKVLIIEDEHLVGTTLVKSLERAGMQAQWATGGVEGFALKKQFQPDVILVDLNLPDTDGIGLVAALARGGDCGIIVVSGLIEEADRVVGLEVGADDYISKPPPLRELLARIRAVDRRVKARAMTRGSVAPHRVSKVGGFSVNFASRVMQAQDGKIIMLTGAEFAALETLFKANGQIVSRDRLSETALRRPWRPDDRAVDQLICSLRQKLTSTDNVPVLHTIRGAGYMLSSTIDA